MRRITPFLAFASGCVATLVGTASVADVRAQTTAVDSIHVCVDEEGVMRLAGEGAVCPQGQRSLFITLDPGLDPKPDEEEPDPEPPEDERIAAIERQLEQFEGCAARGELGNKVVAPFEVLDRSGRRLFYVEEGRASLYNSSGNRVSQLIANESGGYFQGSSAGGLLGAVIGASGDRVGVLISEGRESADGSALNTRVDLGRSEAGTYHLKFMSNGDKVVAAIGQSLAGTGIALIADEAGNVKARMRLAEEQDHGIIEALNDQQLPVAMLTQGTSGGGYLVLYSVDGVPMVDAGITESGVGVVRAGPSGFPAGVGLLGLPGSFIVGKPM